MRDRIRHGLASPYALLALTCVLGWSFKAHCGAFWADGIQYVTGCYSDVVPFWGVRGVAAGEIPYFEARLEYPVLTGALIWIEGIAAHLIGGHAADAATFLGVASLFNAGFAFAILALMARAGVDRTRLLAWALAPPLVLYLGHNWDLLAVALAVAAVLASRAARLRAATALAALGGAAKLFPVLLLPLLGLYALLRRDGGDIAQRIAAAAGLVAIAVMAWGAVNLPVALGAFANWSEFYVFSGARGGTAASVWELLATFKVWRSDIPARNLASAAAFVGGALAIVALGWRRHGAKPWLLLTPVLAWFLLTNKVYSPQFDLWLYPLLLLTSYRLWPVLWFAIGDVLAYFAEFWWFAGLEGQFPAATQTHILIAAIVRGAAMLWIIISAVRDPAPRWTEIERV